jgi:hypothetical protein
MHGFIAIAFAAALAAGAATPPNTEDNTVSPVDVPGASYNRIEMARPDRDSARVLCRYESQPDTHFKKRSCARRRDRDVRERLEHEHLMISQRGFCGGGQLC